MSLTCYCDFDVEPGEVVSYTPTDYTTLDTPKRKRCLSCGTLIEVGSVVAKVERFKVPNHDIEVSIYGEDGEIPRAPGWLCERCADLCFSLSELGFCVNPNDNMLDLVAEYADMQQISRESKR